MEGHVDVIAHDTNWDREVGPGSYCILVRRFPCGIANVIEHATKYAQERIAESHRHGYDGRYFYLTRGDKLLKVVRDENSAGQRGH